MKENITSKYFRVAAVRQRCGIIAQGACRGRVFTDPFQCSARLWSDRPLRTALSVAERRVYIHKQHKTVGPRFSTLSRV